MTTDQERAALVPCPLCGGSDGYKLTPGGTHRWWSVVCRNCGEIVSECRTDGRSYSSQLPESAGTADAAWNEAGKHAQGLRDQIARQASELEALRKDAARYRWIRDDAPDSVVLGFDMEPPYGGVWSAAEMDAAIDAAKEQQA